MTDYVVVLLVEQALSELDARQVLSLHGDVEDPVRYQVLMPVENAALRVESTLGSLNGGDMLNVGTVPAAEVEEIQSELRRECAEGLETSVRLLEVGGAMAEGHQVADEPVKALVEAVAAHDAREVIILTRPHLVAEFFHMDWTAKARRHLGVPVLHLVEHENFDEQAGEGEGVTGL